MGDLLRMAILPPGGCLLLALSGCFLFGRHPIGRLMTATGLVLLYLLSTPMVAGALISRLETIPPLPPIGPLPAEPMAIVILSAEARETPEFRDASPGALTLERLRYGASLERRAHLPVLVSGGFVAGRTYSLGSVMARSLEEDFAIPGAWVEGTSADTRQNALRSAELLREHGITRIFLVTHAWHMPRARLAFEQAGLQVVPAPAAFAGSRQQRQMTTALWVGLWFPTARALQESYYACHEMLGYAVYRLFPPSAAG